MVTVYHVMNCVRNLSQEGGDKYVLLFPVRKRSHMDEPPQRDSQTDISGFSSRSELIRIQRALKGLYIEGEAMQLVPQRSSRLRVR